MELPHTFVNYCIGNYRFIPEAQKKLIITMLDRGQTSADVEHATEISVCTVQRVQRLWLSTGQVIQRPLEAGCQRILTSLEVSVSNSLASEQDFGLFLQFLESLVEQRPDIYLNKLQYLFYMTLMCPSRLLSKPYETMALQGKKLRICWCQHSLVI